MRRTPAPWLLTKNPNARLMAAAPELLAALQAMVAFYTKYPNKRRCGALYDATAAIAKAVQS
jgi:hypothetical protein